MRPRRDFFDTVAPLTDEEEREFAALQANMAMRLVMHKMQPQPATQFEAHRHLPRFSARTAEPDTTGTRGWSPAMLAVFGLLAAAVLWATVSGLAMAF